MPIPAYSIPNAVTFTLGGIADDFAHGKLPDGRDAIIPVSELPNRVKPDAEFPVVEVLPGKPVVVSATRPELVAALYLAVVPELRNGDARVMSVARRAGERSKIAVAPTSEGVDAVASFVGRGANRVKYIAGLLGGERIEVIPFHADLEIFVNNAIAPARAASVDVTNDIVIAYVPGHQVPAAIGGGGLNIALAGELVGRNVDIKPSA